MNVVPVLKEILYHAIQATETEKEGGWEGEAKQAPAKVDPIIAFHLLTTFTTFS